MFEQPIQNQAKINITPLIDIIFQLVIFFMLSTTFIKTEALDVFVAADKEAVPQGAASKASDFYDSEEFKIEVLAEGKILLNGNDLELDNLKSALIDKINAKPNQKIEVIARDGSNVQGLVDIIDIVKKSSATNISIDSL